MKKINIRRKESRKAAVVMTVLALTVSTAMTAWAGQSSAAETDVEAETGLTGYSADKDNTHAIEASGQKISYNNITVTKTGNGDGEEADFKGTNAAVYATDGAELTITDAEISTNGKYANAVFSYGEGTTVNISDSTITTKQRNSGGIMVTGGGTLNAENLTVQTEGGSSAAIRSDRGGGTISVCGGTYTANGSGSPAIYSTADISVSDAELNSGSAQAVVVEGGNTVNLTDCIVTGNNTAKNSDKSDYYQAVMLYQSMSGDAAAGDGSFTMTGGSLTSRNGEIFFVTNATYTINLNDVDITYANDDLLRICAAGWGNAGSNGGQVILNAENQTLKGNIIVDSISGLNMYLTGGSEFTGTFENEGEVYVELEEGSVWNLTADCSISSLTCGEDSINLNGHTLKVGGEVYAEGTGQTGKAADLTSDGKTEGNRSGQNVPSQEKASGEQSGKNSTPPEKPSGEAGTQTGKPEENSTPPEKPSGEPGTQPEIPESDPDTRVAKPEGENSIPPVKPSEKPDAQPQKPGGENSTPPEKPDRKPASV